MLPLHRRRTHPQYVEGCFGCKVTSVTVGGSEVVRDIDRRERVLTEDLRAYRQFRKSGLQPMRLTGAAQLEREARSPLEVEHPGLMSLPDDARAHAAEAAQVAVEMPSILSAHKEKTA